MSAAAASSATRRSSAPSERTRRITAAPAFGGDEARVMQLDHFEAVGEALSGPEGGDAKGKSGGEGAGDLTS